MNASVTLCICSGNVEHPQSHVLITGVGSRLISWNGRTLTLTPSLISEAKARYRIDTVFGQLVDRCSVKRVWARELWHLSSRLLRKVLMYTLVVCSLSNEEGGQTMHLRFGRLGSRRACWRAQGIASSIKRDESRSIVRFTHLEG
ncbi:MAG: hypothetical protein ACXVDA_06105 [Ktedonobacterales bacterium]